MKHFKFGFSDNFKFICREDFTKNQILSFYRPNTTISKLFFWTNAYRLFSKITLKEKEHYRINNQTLFLLKGNNKNEQKFITQTELSLNYIEKWAYLENPGHLKIKKENLIEFCETISQPLEIPVIAGVFLLKSYKNALFINKYVPGANIPENILTRLKDAKDPLQEGIKIAAEQAKDYIHIANGIHLMAVKAEHLIPEILKKADLNLEY